MGSNFVFKAATKDPLACSLLLWCVAGEEGAEDTDGGLSLEFVLERFVSNNLVLTSTYTTGTQPITFSKAAFTL